MKELKENDYVKIIGIDKSISEYGSAKGKKKSIGKIGKIVYAEYPRYIVNFLNEKNEEFNFHFDDLEFILEDELNKPENLIWVNDNSVMDNSSNLKKETVNHPAHYNQGKFEAIDVIEDWKLGFNLGNTVKYISRAEFKENKLQDLQKALWYLQRAILKLENENK